MNQTKPTFTQEHIQIFVDYLTTHAQGRGNAKTSRHIIAALALGKHGDRILRALAHAATESGHLICTGNDGYWLPATADEAEETIGRLHSQGQEMLRRAQSLRTLVHQKFHAAPQLPLVI